MRIGNQNNANRTKMTEKILINKLRGLRDLKPSNEFAALSKLLILNKEESGAFSWDAALIQKLGHLKSLSPRIHFSAVSREFILHHKIKKPATFSTALRTSFNYSLAMGVMAVFMALVTSVGYLGFMSPIPRDIYGKNVTDATNAIKDIDIHLQEAEYFAATDSKTSLALREASMTNLNSHTSPILIERESKRTNFKDPRNVDIDTLLNEATL